MSICSMGRDRQDDRHPCRLNQPPLIALTAIEERPRIGNCINSTWLFSIDRVSSEQLPDKCGTSQRITRERKGHAEDARSVSGTSVLTGLSGVGTLHKGVFRPVWSPFCPSQQRPRRLARPRTPPFHGDNTGSNPVGDANKINSLRLAALYKILPGPSRGR